MTKSSSKSDAPEETSYDHRADQQWMATINDLDENEKYYEQHLYEKLVGNVGVFRWQGNTGISQIEPRALSHLNARFKNIKEFSYMVIVHVVFQCTFLYLYPLNPSSEFTKICPFKIERL